MLFHMTNANISLTFCKVDPSTNYFNYYYQSGICPFILLPILVCHQCEHFRVLEWGDGYYNGDIKTRKTVQAVELNDDQLGLQRSEQLRELYESLSAGDSGPQARRPSAALSPEDLTDTEWYYLVCMSFVFNVGQG